MSYQALARKWRPKSFSEVVGQPQTVTALSNALDSDRLHHAYLFTGTRGVGKTTIARIISKALNCDKGVSAAPCGECGICQAVDAGCFVDLLEVDAASRTKVDDTRELLENVQYRPTQGRYKVYLIDEVHMLSGHSFNALLKTLEEPPPHVKFLLATTDPQKLPVTVLSRCLQFHLRALDVEEITQQIKKILQSEDIAHDEESLTLLARGADGSMRDGLSLLDQAIAYGGGSIEHTGVRDMLGMVDAHYIFDCVQYLIEQKADSLMQLVSELSQRAVNYTSVLDELLLVLHHLSLYKRSRGALAAKHIDLTPLEAIDGSLSEEDLQLYYQIAMMGKRDLPNAPDPRTGFEMTLLRMLAFKPSDSQTTTTPTSGGSSPQPQRSQSPAALARERLTQSSPVSAVEKTELKPVEIMAEQPKPPAPAPAPDVNNKAQRSEQELEKSQLMPDVPVVVESELMPAQSNESDNGSTIESTIESTNIPQTDDEWFDHISRSGLTGMNYQLAIQCAIGESNDTKLTLHLLAKHKDLSNSSRLEAIAQTLRSHAGGQIQVETVVAQTTRETPAAIAVRRSDERLAQAEQTLHADPNVQLLMEKFNATIVPGSIQPGETHTRNSEESL
ncbi:MAG: DNA polymerase III subunit gamma/tau [Arenicellales bacterium WSBS_2016_MAG_OTU3]